MNTSTAVVLAEVSAESRAHTSYTRYVIAGVERVQAALDCGAALATMKETAKHGTWGDTLKRIGVPRTTAARFMRLHDSGWKCATVAQMGGLRSADELLSIWKKEGWDIASMPEIAAFHAKCKAGMVEFLEYARTRIDAPDRTEKELREVIRMTDAWYELVFGRPYSHIKPGPIK